MEQPSDQSKLKPKEAYDLYENGKHRRYSLLFSVNGGAFAIAKLLAGEPCKTGSVLGHLSRSQLSIGMAAFTAIMVWDVWLFGERMRMTYLRDAFGLQGKLVLLLLGALQFIGWLLVGA